MSVDKSLAGIQTFGFKDASAVRPWLAELSGKATAKAADCDEPCAKETRAVTLVTHSTDYAGGRRRTLVAFAQ